MLSLRRRSGLSFGNFLTAYEQPQLHLLLGVSYDIERLSLPIGLCASCALEPPPRPKGIDCVLIDRAAERFPAECADAGAQAQSDAGSTSEDD